MVTGSIAFFFPDFEGGSNYQLFAGDGTWNGLQTSNPQGADFIRWLTGQWGLMELGVAFFVIATAMTGYRRGERWAWYSLWFVPILYGLIALLTPWGQALVPLALLLLVVSLLGLLLPYRKFFPRK